MKAPALVMNLTRAEAQALQTAVYERMLTLSRIEDNNPSQLARNRAVVEFSYLLNAAEALRPFRPTIERAP